MQMKQRRSKLIQSLIAMVTFNIFQEKSVSELTTIIIICIYKYM